MPLPISQITITRSPSTWSPSHNQLTFRCASGVSGQPSMRYIFHLYVNDILINTSKLYPRPDSYCEFDISKLIKDYSIVYFNNKRTAGSYGYSTETLKYFVLIAEEYLSGGNIITNIAKNSGTKYVWCSTVQWEEGKDLSKVIDKFEPIAGGQYIIGSYKNFNQATASEYLNYRNYSDNLNEYNYGTSYAIRSDEQRVLTLMPFDYTTLVKPTCMVILTDSGKIFSKDFTFGTASPTNKLWHEPIGIPELNNNTWDFMYIPGSMETNINPIEDKYYSISFAIKSNGPEPIPIKRYAQTHKSVTFRISDCTRFENYTLLYATQYGGFGSINMNKKSYRSEIIQTTTIDKYLPYNYDETSSITSMVGGFINDELILNTDILRNDNQIFEINDAIRSPKKYLINSKNEYIPVVIKDATISIGQTKQDKNISYSIIFKEAFNKNILL